MTADKLTISFVGDLCIDGMNPANFEIGPEIQTVLDHSDVNVANLECALTNSGRKTPDQPFNLKAPPQKNPILDRFDVYSLANNHILDYGHKGLTDTISFLTHQGKSWFGAGLTENNAFMPLCLHKNNFRLAFLGATRWYNATSKTAGTTPMHLPTLIRRIKQLKRNRYFVIFFPHWNYEYVDYPAPMERKKAHRLVDAGVDLIVGSHPHHVQGVEKYQSKYIFHSLGNFIFPLFDLNHTQFAESFIVTATLSRNHDCRVKLTPTMCTYRGIYAMAAGQRKQFELKMADLSKTFENDRLYKRRFYENAGAIIQATMRSLTDSSRGKKPAKAIVKRLHKIQRQDIYIKLHATLKRADASRDHREETNQSMNGYTFKEKIHGLRHSYHMLGFWMTVRYILIYILGYFPHKDNRFDHAHGTDTCGLISSRDLSISDHKTKNNAIIYLTAPETVTRHMIAALDVDFEKFVFMDFGSGKGRVVMIASGFPFQKIIGIEISKPLHEIAQRNLAIYNPPAKRCQHIEVQCMNALDVELPQANTVFHFYHPFLPEILRPVLLNIGDSLKRHPRKIYILYLYHIDYVASVFSEMDFLKQVKEVKCVNSQYNWALYTNQ